MNDKQKTRVMRRAVDRIAQESDEALQMDLAMDGSGDLGGFICNSAYRSDFKVFTRLLSRLRLDPMTFQLYMEYFIKLEGKRFHHNVCSQSVQSLMYFEMCLNAYEHPKQLRRCS